MKTLFCISMNIPFVYKSQPIYTAWNVGNHYRNKKWMHVLHKYLQTWTLAVLEYYYRVIVLAYPNNRKKMMVKNRHANEILSPMYVTSCRARLSVHLVVK